MDLNDFFSNVSRIAIALETIARNGTPNDYNLVRDVITRRGPRIDTAGTEGRTRPKEVVIDPRIKQSAVFREPIPPADRRKLPKDVVENANDQIIGFVKRIHEDGTKTANGIAKSLVARGIPHPRGLKWNNLSVKPFMDELGLKSPYQVRGGRKPQTQAAPKPEAAKEPAPEPEPAAETRPREPASPVEAGPGAAPEPPEPVAERRVNRAFVEREFKRHQRHDAHLNLRGMLSPETRAKLDAHEKEQAADRALIDEAIAAGRVTKLPACIDSEGNDHSESSTSCTIRPSGIAVSLGSLGPSANGARTRRVVSAR